MATVRILVTSPDTRSERTYSLDLTVGELKRKLFPITGIPIASQSLALLHSDLDDQPALYLANDDQSLQSYGLSDGMHVKVMDLDPSKNMTGQFTDVSLVEKFELSKEEYEKRTDTVKAYKERHKMGRFAESTPNSESISLVHLSASQVGARCRVREDHDSPERRGTIRYIGVAKFGKQDGSIWVGIELDEPLGKNNGLVQGDRYFDCAPQHGVFVKPTQIDIGDYPPVDLLDDSEI